jgi:hypothetical protein
MPHRFQCAFGAEHGPPATSEGCQKQAGSHRKARIMYIWRRTTLHYRHGCITWEENHVHFVLHVWYMVLMSTGIVGIIHFSCTKNSSVTTNISIDS